MVKEEIFGGLKSALQRGTSLKRAMTTFYEAGYPAQEIEEAARELIDKMPTQQMQTALQQKPESKPLAPSEEFVSKVSKYGEEQASPTLPQTPAQQVQQSQQLIQPQQEIANQKVSEYTSVKKKSKKSFLIIALIIILVFLVLSLVAVIVFKDKLIVILNNLFSANST